MEVTAFYGGQHPSEVPFYTRADVAAVCRVPASTLRGWMKRTTNAGPSDALIEPPPSDDGRLSFQNLAEAYLIAQLRSQGGVSLRRLRNTAVYHRERGVARPFLADRGWLVGTGVYLAEGDGLVDASDWGQYVLHPLLRQYLKRIRRDDGRPVALFPSYGGDGADVAVDPRVRFGRPALRGTGIRTATVWGRVQAGESLPAVAEGYGIELDLAAEALRYEASRRAS